MLRSLVAIVLPGKNVFSCKYLPPLYPSSLSGRKKGRLSLVVGLRGLHALSIGRYFSVHDNE
ncbi:hypothetical protein KsCSTR_07300 [Candidatus Kuenenia stuttgartiensis]|uniref:Uncharacterized protein n=1 Tax=Kuenenia stuttgartiensis TaxID=174633 RepID=Q1PZK5_KUEST|nr:hypothetical protein KsCSTR_07300 [Candidatus Kuenenia stuttgartiensis]CAJ72513.1 unknown protein [Candidatus Kuenenia stuttgartiensis]